MDQTEDPKKLSFRKQKQLKENKKQIEIPEGWKDTFKPEDNKGGVMGKTSFATLFPKYRESYLINCWGILQSTLAKYGIKAELDRIEGSMYVETTRKSWDPYAILQARDMIKLLARAVPIEQAKRVFDDGVFCEILKIKNMVRNKERYVKRRQRLIGPNGTTLKAIELLTNCYVLVQGSTVSAIGNYKGLEKVRDIVESCMDNVHPIYKIKTLMIIRELEKDPDLKKEDWSRFLPKYKNKNVSRRKLKKVSKKKEYSPFPPPQPESKVDKELASGEYFMKEEQKQQKKKEAIMEKQQAAIKTREKKRAKYFEAPEEKPYQSKNASNNKGASVDISSLKDKVKNAKKRGFRPNADSSAKPKKQKKG